MAYTGPAPTTHTEQLLLRAEANHAHLRSAEAEQLEIAREWAYAYAVDPADITRHGATHTRQIGAVAMRIWEYAAAELATAFHTHPLAAQKLMADAIDLPARMPHAWEAVMSGALPAWVARKLARLTHDLTPHHARLVDEQLADHYPTLPPGRLLTAAEGRITAADPALHDDAVTEAKKKHEVHLSQPLDGTTTIFARISAKEAARLDAACDLIADILEHHNGDQDQPTRGQLRAQALGILADPQAALDLLHGRDPRRGKATLYLHLTPATLTGKGAARVEDIGPATLKQLTELLGHDHITLKPVIDLNDQPASDCYEIPTHIAERVHLTKPADVFPYAESTSRQIDLDHTKPWPHGPTTTTNLGKLIRRHHRIKTHAQGWDLTQLPGHRYLWRTPHGRYLLVDRHGTHPVTIEQAAA